MIRWTAIAVVSVIVFSNCAFGAPQYFISKIGKPTANTADINNHGQVTVTILPENLPGMGTANGEVLLVDGALELSLPFMSAYGPKVGQINDAGQIVGAFEKTEGTEHSFLYDGAAIFDLGTFGGQGSLASGINNQGDVVGQKYQTGSSRGYILPSGGNLELLPTLGGDNALAAGINEHGHVVGWSETGAPGSTMAFYYDGASISPLGTLGGGTSSASRINDAGLIVGQSSVATGGAHAALFTPGADPIDLAPTWSYSGATDINASGQIVGQVFPTVNDLPQAALFAVASDPSLLINLIPANSEWSALHWATGINDRGQIVGVGSIVGQSGVQAFLMTPVPEPNASILLFSAVGFLARRTVVAMRRGLLKPS